MNCNTISDAFAVSLIDSHQHRIITMFPTHYPQPTSEMLDEIKGFAKVSRDGDDGDFEIPMRVAVPDQALPATFTLKGSLVSEWMMREEIRLL